MSLNRISDLTSPGTIVDAQTLFEIEQQNLTSGERSRRIALDALRTETRRSPGSAKSADYTITGRSDDHIILVTAGASDRTVDLPDSATDELEAGDEFEVHKIDSGAGAVTVATQGSDTMQGATSIPLPQQYNFLKVRWTGAYYAVIERRESGPVTLGFSSAAGWAATGVANQDLEYRRDGNLVHIHGYIQFTATGGALAQGDSVLVDGLPYDVKEYYTAGLKQLVGDFWVYTSFGSRNNARGSAIMNNPGTVYLYTMTIDGTPTDTSPVLLNLCYVTEDP